MPIEKVIFPVRKILFTKAKISVIHKYRIIKHNSLKKGGGGATQELFVLGLIAADSLMFRMKDRMY